MSEEKKDQNTEFVVEPLSDEELEDVSGGAAESGCTDGSGCCDGFLPSVEAS